MKTDALIVTAARELAQRPVLADATRADLLAMIRKATGSLPFALALGDDADDQTVWVQIARASDDQLRFYLAFNELGAMMAAQP